MKGDFKYNAKSDTFTGSFGVSDERKAEIDNAASEAIAEWAKESNGTTGELVDIFLRICSPSDINDWCYCSFAAGLIAGSFSAIESSLNQ